MFRLLYNFIRYNPRRAMTLQALFLAGYYRFLLKFVPVKTLQPRFGQKGQETPLDVVLTLEQRQDAYWIQDRVERVANRTPWQSRCFVRALVAQRLLCARGLSSSLYLGVGKSDEGAMRAHAWVRCGPHYITGGDGTGYATVAKFAKWP